MNLVNWNPFGTYDEFFNRPFGGLMPRLGDEDGPSILSADMTWRPAADISETDNEYLVKAQLPGVSKEDVKISFDNGVLTIEGERKIDKSTDDEKLRRTETFYGKYSRSFALPEGIDEDKVTAKAKDGVLTVTLPKTSEPARQPKTITVD